MFVKDSSRAVEAPGDLFQGHRSPAFRGQKLRIPKRLSLCTDTPTPVGASRALSN